jgi:hypothetical protein
VCPSLFCRMYISLNIFATALSKFKRSKQALPLKKKMQPLFRARYARYVTASPDSKETAMTVPWVALPSPSFRRTV